MARPRPTDRLRLLGPGLGRQMFLLFVGCALVPIAVLSLLSWDRVGEELEDQSRVRLHHAARRTGMLLMDRLARVEELVAEAGLERPGATLPARLTGRTKSIRPEDSIADASDPALAGRDPARPILFVRGAAAPVEIWLRTPARDGGPALRVELDRDHLFDISHQNVLPSAGEACVVTSDGVVVWSSRPGLACEPVAGGRTDTPALVTQDLSGEAYLTLEWLLFLDAAYQDPGWTIVVAEPRDLVMAPVDTFRTLVLLVSALTSCVVALLAARQIHRQLVPLEELEAAAQRIGKGEVGVMVPVASDDELGRVSSAFNQMSSQMTRQLSSMAELIEMDREILAVTSRDELVRVALDAVSNVAHAASTALVLPTNSGPGEVAWNIARRRAGAPEIVIEFPRWIVASASWYDESLDVMRVGSWELEPEVQEALGCQGGMIEWYPLVVKSRCLGLVVREVMREPDLGRATALQLRKLCDQIAAAIHGLQLRAENDRLQHFDSLTGLPNLASHAEALNAAIGGGARDPLCVIRIVVTGIARYGNNFGESESQRVISEVSGVLREQAAIHPARVDSDAFGCFFVGADTEAIVGRIRAISNRVRQTIDGFSGAHGLGVVIGSTLSGLDGVDAMDLIRKADVAAAHVVAVGRDAIEFFSDEMERTFRQASDLEASLERALEEDQLHLEYQPIFDVQTGALAAGEALVRWTCPRRGRIAPDVFIPVAEECGLIQRLGDWVLERAFTDVARWRASGLLPVRISVNVSASQVTNALVDRVEELLRNGGARPEDIGIELTESALLAESDNARRVLQRIRASGLSISIDDFGTGYASLDYLRRFEVDVVKIDSSFLQGVPESQGDCDLTRAAIAVGSALGLKTVAEGCEREEQLQFLERSGCDLVQGYLLGRPMPASDFAKLIAEAAQASMDRDPV